MSIEPLYLPEQAPETTAHSKLAECLFCEEAFAFDNVADVDALNTHLVSKHHFVISEILKVPDLAGYLRYWKSRIDGGVPLTEICSVIKTNCGKDDVAASEEFFLLAPEELEEDETVRAQLAVDKLSKVLNDQQTEREDTSFRRRCLFCKEMFSGNRSVLFDHLTHDHNFSVGHPDNIVYVKEFLDVIDKKLHKRICLFCEKTFTDWEVLKEHMRKKQHKKINPDNKEYDKFYLVNYLEPGKDWKTLGEEREEKWEDEESNGEDWVAGPSNMSCLFCELSLKDIDSLGDHMKEEHSFHIENVHKWPFYKKVKLVNYIRRCAHLKKCFYCSEEFEDSIKLTAHLQESKHTSLMPNEDLWNLAEFYFPTYENDTLLHSLPDDGQPDESIEVVEEDPADNKSCDGD